MTADVESDVLSVIHSGTSYTEGTNLFRGPVYPPGEIGGGFMVPHKAAFVRFSSGVPPIIHRVDGLQEKEWLVDIIVRGEPWKYNATRMDAQAILDAVNDASISGYVDARTQTSSPQWIDRDESGSDYFAITVRLRKLEA